MLTSREEYIKKTFFNDLSEVEATDLVKKISAIGDAIGFIGENINQDQDKAEKRKHKYDVWISKEVKKDKEVLNKMLEIRLIVDWASEINADIFQYSFYEAFNAQQEWHEDMRRKHQIENLDIPDIDENRVIFRFSDKEHFLYLLTANDLVHEGAVMGHCVGGNNYKSKIKNNQSLILSIRDKYNMPHVTIEVDVNSRNTVQKYGKGNKPPVAKYLRMYSEYALFASGFKDLENKEILKFLNLDLGLKGL
ncbi:MAG: PcfJ domain-containing protein [Nanoarchaeota archaeon]